MTQTRNGTQSDFGMKAHIGVNAESGLVPPVECTTAKVADITMIEACLHGQAEVALGNRSDHKTNRTIAHFLEAGYLAVLAPTKKLAGGELSEKQKALFAKVVGFNLLHA